MLYKRVSFRTQVPVDVDWGDGTPISYPAGVISGYPTGEVVITSNDPVESIEFLEDTIAVASFDDAPDFKDASELFKDKHNIQVVYFDKNSPITTVRETFMDSGIFYHADLFYNTPKQLQYLHLRAPRLECIEGLNTTNAFNAYDMFRETPNLKHPRPFEIEALEDTDNGGCAWANTFQCIHPIYHDNTVLDEITIPIEFPTKFDAPTDYIAKFAWDTTVSPDEPAYYRSWVYDGAHIDTANGWAVFDGSNDYIGTNIVTDRDYGTVSVWAYRRQDGRNYDTIFVDSYSARNHCWIPTDNKIYYRLDDNNKGRCSSAVTVPPNTWVHIAITYSPTSVSIYMNGDKVGGTDNVVFEGSLFQQDRDWLYFGGNNYVTDLYGYLKKVRVYSRELYPEEIKAIYLEEL